MGVIDVPSSPEPLGGGHRDPHTTAHSLEQRYISRTLRELKRFKIETILERRYEKFRNLGEYNEPTRKQAKASA